MKKSMDKFSKFITRHKLFVIGIMLILAVLSMIAMSFVHVNTDLFSYLPQDMSTRQGLNYLERSYGMGGDVIVGVSDISYSQFKEKIAEVEKLDGVNKGGVLWLGSIYELKNIDLQELIGKYDNAITRNFLEKMLNDYGYSLQRDKYKDGVKLNCVYDIQISDMVDEMIAQDDVKNLFFPENGAKSLKEAIEDDSPANYVMIVELGVSSASDEAMNFVRKMPEVFDGYECSVGGSTKIIYDLYTTTIDEVWKYIIVAVLVMFIILLFATDNLVEPFILLATLGIAVLLNMGTNLMFSSVSVITYAASTILQIGLSMDYAIFLIHSFKSERRYALNDEQAMQRAIPKTFSTITASSLTTVGGFMALLFMRFGIGRDLGLVLAKGVILSLITIIFMLPCVVLMTRKWQIKTKHAVAIPKLQAPASFSVKHRKVFALILVLMLLPVMITQSFINLSYVKFNKPKENPTQIDNIVSRMSNSIIVVLPMSYKDEQAQKENLKNHTLRDKNIKFVQDVKNDKGDNVTGVLGIYSIVSDEYHSLAEFLCEMVNSDQKFITNALPPEADTLKALARDDHNLYFVMVEGDSESNKTASTLSNIRSSLYRNFSSGTYITGVSQAKFDLESITPIDFLVITFVSILIIMAILMFTMKSFKISAMIIIVIEFGIFVNLSISVLTGSVINFIGYVIISSIQLGSTVDYAILYAVKYKKYIEHMPAREASYRSLNECAMSVITSVAIIAGCCMSVFFITSNLVVQEITALIARGSIISGILVLFVLPSITVLATGKVANLTPTGRREARAVNNFIRNNYRKATRMINHKVRQVKKDIHNKFGK